MEQTPTPANDIAALLNEQVMFVPDDNCKNPLREAKHQREILKDYFTLPNISESY